MKKGDIIECSIEETVYPATGLAHIPGTDREIRVKNTIPGEKVRCRVRKLRSGTAEAWPLEQLQKAPDEIAPDCIHFGRCGGCAYRRLSYGNQLKLKEKQVRKILEDLVPEECFEKIIPGPRIYGYRNKMEFSFGDEYKGGPLELGMHCRDAYYDIVTIDGCRIISEDFRRILSCVLGVCRSAGLSAYNRTNHKGYLRHLVVRGSENTGGLLVNIVTSTQAGEAAEQRLEEDLVSALLKLSLDGEICGILHTENDNVADTVTNGGMRLLYGRDWFTENILGLTFKITPFSFFQTNSAGAAVLYEKVREYAGETRGKTIYDLYSGTGTIAQILAPVAHKVTGVEIVEEAVDAARTNAALNHLDNCSFLSGDVLKVLDSLPEKPDLIVLDPPREGIHPKALQKIIAYGVRHIVYISCKPTSLQNDLTVLERHGYRPTRCCMVDMFPGTAQIETVAALTAGANEC